jgi:hypothetical protein
LLFANRELVADRNSRIVDRRTVNSSVPVLRPYLLVDADAVTGGTTALLDEFVEDFMMFFLGNVICF